MADNATVQGLIALANNAGASMEERRTAAFQAVTIMHKRNLSGESGKVSVDAEWHEFERRMLRTQLQATYVGALSKVTSVLEPEIGAASGATGYAELNQLCWGLARVMGDVVLTPSLVDADVAQIEGSLRFVVAAFSDWQSRQPSIDLEQVRSAVTALFDAEPTPEPSRAAGVSIASRLHFPVESMQTVLQAMVAEGLLRCKGGSYSKAKRPRKARAANG
jgi:hypothetical protein